MKESLKVGIVGVGRLGAAIARLLPQTINVLLADKQEEKSREVVKSREATVVDIDQLFQWADFTLITLPPQEIVSVVKTYHDNIKPHATLINMATSLPTEAIRTQITRDDIIIIGLKPITQAYAMSLGYQSVFVLAKEHEHFLERLKKLFYPMGTIVVGDEMIVKEINAEATRFGLHLAIQLRHRLCSLCSDRKMIDAAVKTVAVGTILDYPPKEPNEYIQEKLKELEMESYSFLDRNQDD